MKISVVITKKLDSIQLLKDIVSNGNKIDNVVVYSKNISMEAPYQANAIIQALKDDGINIIEQKPNYPYEHFRGAIIISNS